MLFHKYTTLTTDNRLWKCTGIWRYMALVHCLKCHLHTISAFWIFLLEPIRQDSIVSQILVTLKPTKSIIVLFFLHSMRYLVKKCDVQNSNFLESLVLVCTHQTDQLQKLWSAFPRCYQTSWPFSQLTHDDTIEKQ